jgi:hypothetical protein
LIRSYIALGFSAQAREFFRISMQEYPTRRLSQGLHILCLASTNDPSDLREAQTRLSFLESTDESLEKTVELIFAYAGLRSVEKGLLQLAKLDPRNTETHLLSIDPLLDPFRSHPQFAAIIDRITPPRFT